jgi:glycerol kinase
MKTHHILAIDQGTTMTTALVMALSPQKSLQILAKSSVGFPQHYPHPNWVEHNLEEIWASVETACTQALAKAKREHGVSTLSAIGLTNQRETLCLYHRKTLRPLHPAIVWQCKRSMDLCTQLKSAGLEDLIRAKTGLLCDPYFTATKLQWVLESQPHLRTLLQTGEALMGTLDTYLLSKLTGGAVHATEPSNASRTLLLSLETGQWDPELLSLFSLPSGNWLPEVRPSAGIFGHTQGVGFLPDGIPISGILGDQQAALAGQACFSPGEAKCTYGTGAFLLSNLGTKPLISKERLLTTIAWQLPDGSLTYALEGASFIAGAAVQLLRDGLGWIHSAEESETVSQNVTAAPDLYFVPALSGLGAPWWIPAAKGALFGLTRSTSKEQLVRATLEGICFQICDLLSSMERGLHRKMEVLRVDGGASANGLLLQIQSDLLNLRVERPKNLDTTAVGAALFAALGLGLFSSLEEIRSIRTLDRGFDPHQDKASLGLRAQQLAGWKRAVEASILFSQPT